MTRTPGLTLRHQPHVEVDSSAVIDAATTAPALWHQLLDHGLADVLTYAVRERVGDAAARFPDGSYRIQQSVAEDQLQAAGATDQNGYFAACASNLATPTDCQKHVAARNALYYGRKGDLYGETDALADGPLALVLDNTVPRVQVVIKPSFFGRDASDRRAICRVLAQLAGVCDLHAVTSMLTARQLAHQHARDLPSDVTQQVACSKPTSTRSEQADRALDALAADGNEIAFVRYVAASDDETQSYADLQRKLGVSRKTMAGYVKRLRCPSPDDDNGDDDGETGQRLGLVREFRDGRAKYYSLTEVGQRVLSAIADARRQQTAISEYVTRDPNSPTNNRTSRRAHGGGEGGDHPPYRRRMNDDVVTTRWAHRRDRTALFATGEPSAVTLVETPGNVALDGFENDRRSRYLAYDPSRPDRVGVIWEASNPVPCAVGPALTLTSTQMFSEVLPADRLDGERGQLDGLELDDPVLLRGLRRIGWLSNETTTGREVVANLEEWHTELREQLTTLREMDDGDRKRSFRGTVTQNAMGLWGSMVHLLDIAGIDVHLELRLPNANEEFAPPSKRDRWKALALSIAKNVAIQSKHGQYAIYPQVFEDREQARSSALDHPGDLDNPLGEYIASLSIVGPRVTALAADLRDALDRPADLRDDDDAPALAVRVAVEDASTRQTVERAARRVCESKNLRPTRAAVSVLHGLTESARATARALHALQAASDPSGRDIRLDEVRYALSTLPASELVPSLDGKASAVFAALLRNDDGYQTTTEWASDAGVTPATVQKHAARLLAFGLARETAGGYYIKLPVPERGERGMTGVQPPAVEEGTRYTDVLYDGLLATARATWIHRLDWYAEAFGEATARLPWLDGWLAVLRALGSDPRRNPPPAQAVFGRIPDQQTLAEPSGSSGPPTGGTAD